MFMPPSPMFSERLKQMLDERKMEKLARVMDSVDNECQWSVTLVYARLVRRSLHSYFWISKCDYWINDIHIKAVRKA